MNIKESIDFVKRHQEWRLGAEMPMAAPSELTYHLNVLITYCEGLKKDKIDEIKSDQEKYKELIAQRRLYFTKTAKIKNDLDAFASLAQVKLDVIKALLFKINEIEEEISEML